MRSMAFNLALVGLAFVSRTASMSAGAPKDACSALTQAQVTAALGAAVAAGTPISGPASCQWFGKGKVATLTIRQQLKDRSPVDQFNRGKQGLPGIPTEPISGVGDDAFYISFAGATRSGLGLVVKKGTSVFEIRVYGFDVDQAKGVAKTLAQTAAATF